jgi:hypothetical protein
VNRGLHRDGVEGAKRDSHERMAHVPSTEQVGPVGVPLAHPPASPGAIGSIALFSSLLSRIGVKAPKQRLDEQTLASFLPSKWYG